MHKVGAKVKGTTIRGNAIAGTVAEVRDTAKGQWVGVQVGEKIVRTRPKLLQPT